MDNEKVIVALLLIAILLSVVTLAITLSADVQKKNAESVNPADLVGVESADVQLNVLPNPAKGGSS